MTQMDPGSARRRRGRRIGGVEDARRKALFLGQLLELSDHGIDRAVVAGRLRMNERNQPARGLRRERGEARRQPSRRAGADFQETAPRDIARRVRR